MDSIIANMREAVGTAGKEAVSYGKVLEEFSCAVEGKAGDTADVADAMSLIIRQTKAMAERNAELEDQFAKSGEEMADLRRSLDDMRLAANTDSLTGIANRKHFDARIKELIEEAAVGGEPLAILLADIDHFKSFNDNFGHQVGDHVLRLVSAALGECVRGRDFVARYGGEEFAIILPQTALDGALAVAENVRATIASKRLTRKSTGENLGNITISLGAALYKDDEGPDSLVARADEGLYKAKRDGRNRVESVEPMAAKVRHLTPIAS